MAAHFAARAQLSAVASAKVEASVNAHFEARLEAAYMAEGSPLAHIDPSLPDYLEGLRKAGVKVGLNTGHPRPLQAAILAKLRLDEMVDAYVSAQDVSTWCTA